LVGKKRGKKGGKQYRNAGWKKEKISLPVLESNSALNRKKKQKEKKWS